LAFWFGHFSGSGSPVALIIMDHPSCPGEASEVFLLRMARFSG
jgi:hypothetical protein